ncbi:MAG: hypothetical protein D6778_10835 [Nitrospirae bacterium]|nr:MAG: hypothetical protein D6778_10835 [Nitrospirota bacterium]
MSRLEAIKRIAEVEFADIVRITVTIDYKLRIILIDNSFIDVSLSQRLPDKFGFHWERKDENATIFRYDNFPDRKWAHVSTFPYHFHRGSHDKVEPSPFPLDIIEGFRAFMVFVRDRLKLEQRQ